MFSKKVHFMKDFFENKIFDTELMKWATQKLFLLIVQYFILDNLIEELRLNDRKIFDIIFKNKYKIFLQIMMKKLIKLLAKINEIKIITSNANSLTRLKITAIFLSIDIFIITTQKHHVMFKNYSRIMLNTTKLFRKKIIAYNSIVCMHATKLQKNILIIKTFVNWIFDLMLKINKIKKVVDLSEKKNTTILISDSNLFDTTYLTKSDKTFSESSAMTTVSVKAVTSIANLNISNYQHFKFDTLSLLILLHILKLHLCEC